MEALQTFIEYLTNEKRFSAHTIRAYRDDIASFYSFIEAGSDAQVLEATSNEVRLWLVNYANNNLSPRTFKRKLSSLKAFYKFQMREGVILKNPAETVLAPKNRNSLPEFFSSKEVANLFDYVVFPGTYEGVRDKTILNLFYYTGIRLSELVNIKENDIDFSLKQIKVTGKRSKQRYIPVSELFLQELKSYLKIKAEIFDKVPGEDLFLTIKGKSVYNRLVQRIVNKYLGQVTTSDKRHPHKLRHTFATHMLNNGADLNAIKELLGHANLAATEVYTHNSYEKLKSIYNQAHPRA